MSTFNQGGRFVDEKPSTFTNHPLFKQEVVLVKSKPVEDVDAILLSFKTVLMNKRSEYDNKKKEVEQCKQDLNALRHKINDFYTEFNNTFSDQCRTQNDCCICLTSLADLTIKPCGHTVCSTCIVKIKKCPICDNEIIETQKIYYN